MSYPVYGFYLIPPPEIVYLIGIAHQLLASQFHSFTAGRFMVHATIKGFFKLRDGAALEDFQPALDKLMADTPPVTTRLTELYSHTGMYGSSVLVLLDRTPELHRLHNAVWNIVRPLIAPDCPFSSREFAGDFFSPHLTLAMADFPTEPGLLAQAEALCQFIYTTLPATTFQASHFQLIRCDAPDWQGEWWRDLTFTQLKGWQATGRAAKREH